MAMTTEQMRRRIAQLEAMLAQPTAKESKAAEKERKAQFKRDAWVRAHLHTTITRYAR